MKSVCVCVCVCERERERVCVNEEGKANLCTEILKSPFLDFLTDLRRGSQLPGLLSPTFTFKITFDLPDFS